MLLVIGFYVDLGLYSLLTYLKILCGRILVLSIGCEGRLRITELVLLRSFAISHFVILGFVVPFSLFCVRFLFVLGRGVLCGAGDS